jgi:GNAT superfamily N-acetyltransferase
VIRDATPTDIDLLVAYTLQEAQEAEGYEADVNAVRRGVEGAFNDRSYSEYWVAECEGQPVGSVSVVQEWSNFRGGHYWWVQSVFVAPDHRGTGVIQLLIDHVASVAQRSGALDLRLYAHASNERALRAYRRCGFEATPYVMMAKSLDVPLPSVNRE